MSDRLPLFVYTRHAADMLVERQIEAAGSSGQSRSRTLSSLMPSAPV